jgi:glycogen debranching enzyme
MNLAILGSIRNMRDYTEGGNNLAPEIQEGVKYHDLGDGKGALSRVWLDNKTTTHLVFAPVNDADDIQVQDDQLTFGAGDYHFRASFDYPQLQQLDPTDVLNPASQHLLTEQPDRTKSLSFLSYEGKLLAGAWRFLTYFGRDSMISMLLLQPVLSIGKGSATEAVISAVLERIDQDTGTVCHEETIGDYATYLNMQAGKTSTRPSCNYVMIDSDYYLPIVMNNYFVQTKVGKKRTEAFFNQEAVLHFGNRGQKYSELAQISAEKIMDHAARFAAPGQPRTKENLRHLEANQLVGQWRDSGYGIGGGRTPFDVNTALVPAALRAIASLSRNGFFPSHPHWGKVADQYAKVWEDETLHFFSVSVPKSEAKSLVSDYVQESNFKGPAELATIKNDVGFHGLALDGNDGQEIVRVMNTDVAFRLYLLNTTNDEQLSSLLTETSRNILMPFPAGLSTDVGLLVSNPAYGDAPVYAKNWTHAAYHGTVVWGWQLAMMAKGLERQLGRCIDDTYKKPQFCRDKTHGLVKRAYNHLWDLIEKNEQFLSLEVWSWRYNVQQGVFEEVDLGVLSATGKL